MTDTASATDYYPGSIHPVDRRADKGYSAEEEADNGWDQTPGSRRVYPSNGVDTEFFTLGALAAALNRKPVTLRAWERSRLIPGATFISRKSDIHARRRLYTRPQIEGLVNIAGEEGVLHPLISKDGAEYFKHLKKTNFTERSFQLFRDLQQRRKDESA